MLLIDDAIVVTLNDDHDVFFDGAIAVDGDRIVAVGTSADVRARIPEGTKVLDARGGAVMPGLVDLHYHTALGRGWADHLPLAENLQRFWYPLVRAIDPEAVYWGALLSYAESISFGVTTVNDMYRHIDSMAKAADEIGIRAVLSNVVADDEHGLDTLASNEAGFRSSNGAADGRVEVKVGIEWLPLASIGLLHDASSLAADACGLGDRKGHVRVGHDADLIILEGDPLSDIGALHSLDATILAGEVIAS